MTQITATLIDSMGSDLSVVNAARVSFGKESEWEPAGAVDDPYSVIKLKDKDKRLIQFLAKHKHLSPFGHAFASFHIKAPIFVARQLVKHKFLRWNEISRRYVDDEPEFYTPDVWRGRSADKKQGSEGVVAIDYSRDYSPFCEDWDLDDGRRCSPEQITVEVYKDLLARGVAPEQARMILPQSTMTEWYWSGSLDAFAAMCRLRCAPDTQYESRLVADPISDIMAGLFPVSWAALMGEN